MKILMLLNLLFLPLMFLFFLNTAKSNIRIKTRNRNLKCFNRRYPKFKSIYMLGSWGKIGRKNNLYYKPNSGAARDCISYKNLTIITHMPLPSSEFPTRVITGKAMTFSESVDKWMEYGK